MINNRDEPPETDADRTGTLELEEVPGAIPNVYSGPNRLAVRDEAPGEDVSCGWD
jgi:hypothetical protein